MNYVMHICKNKNCNSGWIDKDLTLVKSLPPSWKYCKQCAEKLGIDYENQKPSDFMSEERIAHYKNVHKAKDKTFTLSK